jgi:hypothetical protein
MNDKPAPEVMASWTIKKVPQADRVKIVEAAKRADMTVWEWVRSASRMKLDREHDANGVGQVVPELLGAQMADAGLLACKPANDERPHPGRQRQEPEPSRSAPARFDDEDKREMRERIGLLEGQCASLSRRLDRLSKLLDVR